MPEQLSLFNQSQGDEDNTPKTVSQLTSHIRYLLDRDPALQDVWVEGEVSNLRQAPSGHVYFSLKDSDAQLKCVMWRSTAQKVRILPAHGDLVLVHGKVSVYEQGGVYQLYADAIQPAGVGDLNRQYEMLKAMLYAEGLFADETKRPLPTFPRKIGIVSSPTAAGFQDVLNILERRFPAASIILSPALVQGQSAPPRIINAIQALHRIPDIDVILIIRGGGSLEDLWCFNDEGVVREVAASSIPIITGVGHEIDFTLVDFAADQRAPTPSAAAELATPDRLELLNYIQKLDDRLSRLVQARLGDARGALESGQRTLRLLTPSHRITTARQSLDDQAVRMERNALSRLQNARQRLDTLSARLHAANPHRLLARGYTILTDENGQRLTRAEDVALGGQITVQMSDGTLSATVTERNIQNNS